MARKYSKGAAKKVKRALHKKKRGTLKSERSGRTVTSRKQAIAIGAFRSAQGRKESAEEENRHEKAEDLMAAKRKKKAAPRTGTRGKPNRKPQQNKRGGHHGIVRDERGQDQPRDRGAT